MCSRLSHKWGIIVLFFFVFLASCSITRPPMYDAAKGNVGEVKSGIDVAEDSQYRIPAPVVTSTGAYIDSRRVSLIQPPSWLSRKVALHGSDLPFDFYMTEMLENSGALIHYDKSLNKKTRVSIDYTGTVQGALDELSTRTDYHYDIDNKKGALTWSAFVTTTFDISFMPGTSKYMVGEQQGGSSSSSDDLASGGVSGSSGSSSGADTTYAGVDVKDTQYSSLTGDLSLWKDLDTTIRNLLSTEGSVTVSESTSTVTVRDHPENVKAIGMFLDKMNIELSKQVRIQVQLLEVELNDNFTYGINWNLVRSLGQDSLQLTGSLANNVSTSTSLSPVGIAYVGGGTSKWSGTNVIVNALQNQGKVSMVTQPTVTTLNNQVAEISIQVQTSYVASVGTTLASEGTSQSEVTPGIVTSGFSLYLLPRIQDTKVYLQLSTTLANLISIDTINTSTGAVVPPDTSSTSTTQTASSTPQIIQVPTLESRNFNQRTVIPTGATLILAGFKDMENRTNNTKFLDSTLLGGRGSDTSNTELVMLITPVILTDGEHF